MQTPRELRLVVVRTLGDIGTISVDYTIMYLPPGASEGAVAVEMGSERLQGGQSSRDFSVTIPESMFLEPEGTFSAIITNTSLVGGGECVGGVGVSVCCESMGGGGGWRVHAIINLSALVSSITSCDPLSPQLHFSSPLLCLHVLAHVPLLMSPFQSVLPTVTSDFTPDPSR